MAQSYYDDRVPRLIDHQQRRRELADAVWRVIARAGVGAVSVRTVAAEAGVSTGSLRHVLPTKGLLLASAMELVISRGIERSRGHGPEVATLAAAADRLEELLPLDDQRRLEMGIHLALMAEAAGHPELADLREAPDQAVAAGCRALLGACDRADLLREGLDLDEEALHLHVVVDGLALHLLGPSARMSGPQARRLLDDHLLRLAGPAGLSPR